MTLPMAPTPMMAMRAMASSVLLKWMLWESASRSA